MKRTITFLLVLSILLTSFACSSKQLPETFTPLEVKLKNAALSTFPSQKLNLTSLWDEVKALLTTSEWTENKTVTVNDDDLVITATDDDKNTYDFYRDSSVDQPVVVITRDGDNKAFSYTISVEVLDGFALYVQSSLVILILNSSALKSLKDIKQELRSTLDENVLKSIKSVLKIDQWVLSEYRDPEDGAKRFEIGNAVQDTITLYSATPQSFAIVTRSNQSALTFSIPNGTIEDLDVYLAGVYEEALLHMIEPESVYVGTKANFTEAKLVPLPQSAVELYLSASVSNSETYTKIDSSLINPNAKILFMTKNVNGTYTTVYADESTKITSDEWRFKVSVGKDPFHGPDNVAYTLFGWEAQTYYLLLALFLIESSEPLDLAVDTQTTYTFPHWDLGMSARLKTTVGKLNSSMLTYFNGLEANAQQTSFDLSQSSYFTLSFNLRTSSGTEYLFVGNGVFVDEDPKTPGAVYYQFDASTDFSSFHLEYLANLPITVNTSTIQITEYKIPDTQDWVKLTSTQANQISQLIQESSWSGSEHHYLGGGGDPDVILKTSTGDILTFLYYAGGEGYESEYVLFRVNNSGQYFIPLDEFEAIYTLFQTFLP